MEIISNSYLSLLFKNDPKVIAKYFKELLFEENYISYFDSIVFAIFDKSKDKNCINTFINEFK